MRNPLSIHRTILADREELENGLMIAEKKGFLPPEPAPGAKLGWLSIQGKDCTWHWADARIDGSELIVSSKEASSGRPPALQQGRLAGRAVHHLRL